MAKVSPTQNTLKLLRSEGYTAQVVERWNHFAKIRQDLFGCIDVLGIHRDHPGMIAVQCTSDSNLAARITKILPMEIIEELLLAGNQFEFHGWKKKNNRWQVRRKAAVLTTDGVKIEEAT